MLQHSVMHSAFGSHSATNALPSSLSVLTRAGRLKIQIFHQGHNYKKPDGFLASTAADPLQQLQSCLFLLAHHLLLPETAATTIAPHSSCSHIPVHNYIPVNK